MKIRLGTKNVISEKSALVMGIVNATPDSFYHKTDPAFEIAMKFIEQGADILDIGGESTRPGFTEVSVEDEINRVVPLIKEIRKVSDIAISLDTRKAEVLKEVCNYGIDIFNDVSYLDEEKAEIVKKNDLSLVIMHGFGLPETERPEDKNITDSLISFFNTQIEFAAKCGISSEKLILDPGIGFGKTFNENVQLIKECNKYAEYFSEIPVLMALSRKRCIGQITNTVIEERLAGTLAANILSVQKGASIVRVHDVKETVDALNIMKYMN